MKTYHDTTTGKFVSNDPAGTVDITSFDLRQELIDFANEVFVNPNDEKNTEDLVDKYLNQK